jgi:DNA-binding NarL/FixJ family response regulator
VSGVDETLHLTVMEDETRRPVAVERRSHHEGVPMQSPNPLRVVLDLALPGLSGVELLVQLHRVDAPGAGAASDVSALAMSNPSKPAHRSAGTGRPEVNVIITETRTVGAGADGAMKKCAMEHDRWATLTAAELEVALLAAGGLTNRQISERLFTSHRTTETHLARTYRKLGISGRTQLAAEVARRNR